VFRVLGLWWVRVHVKKVDVNKGLDSYYSQPRTVDLVTIKGSNMTISAIGGVADVAKFGLGFYYGNQMLGKALEQPRTVSPEIVRPEVVTVGGGQ
jgi:hypothetical protein